ncbi:MAG: serine protease [Burkholderiaceae bacterium]
MAGSWLGALRRCLVAGVGKHSLDPSNEGGPAASSVDSNAGTLSSHNRPMKSSVLNLANIATLMVGLWLAPSAQAGLVEVVAAAKPSVVAVGTFSALANPRFGFRGSGFAVRGGNLVVTNAHVLPPTESGGPEARLVIQTPRGKAAAGEIRAATVVAVDREHDLVLLRFEGAGLPALDLAQAEIEADGLSIAVIGFPIGGLLGFTPVTHHGIISAVTPIVLPAPNSRQLDQNAIARLRRGSFDIYQLDANAYPGNSGGPVLNDQTGEVVGVINMVLIRGLKESALSQPTGISYAIPVRYVRQLLNQQ